MLKKKLLFHIVIFSIVVLILYSFVYHYYSFYEGKPGYSSGIDKAKNLGVFLKRYEMFNDKLYIANKYSVRVGEIWLEKVWTQGNIYEKVRIAKHNNYSNYWLYMEILNSDNKPTREFLDTINDTVAIFNSEGRTFSIRKMGNREFLFTSYKNLPSKSEKLKIVSRTSVLDRYSIATKWKNPKIEGIISIISK